MAEAVRERPKKSKSRKSKKKQPTLSSTVQEEDLLSAAPVSDVESSEVSTQPDSGKNDESDKPDDESATTKPLHSNKEDVEGNVSKENELSDLKDVPESLVEDSSEKTENGIHTERDTESVGNIATEGEVPVDTGQQDEYFEAKTAAEADVKPDPFENQEVEREGFSVSSDVTDRQVFCADIQESGGFSVGSDTAFQNVNQDSVDIGVSVEPAVVEDTAVKEEPSHLYPSLVSQESDSVALNLKGEDIGSLVQTKPTESSYQDLQMFDPLAQASEEAPAQTPISVNKPTESVKTEVRVTQIESVSHGPLEVTEPKDEPEDELDVSSENFDSLASASRDPAVPTERGLLRQASQSEEGFEFVSNETIVKTVTKVDTGKTQEADVLETIETFKQPVAASSSRTEVKTHDLNASKIDTPVMPKQATKDAVVHRKVHAENVQTARPMTIEQIQALYYNPQLAKNPQFIEDFVLNEAKKDNHEFFEILLSYFRSRKNLISAEEDVKGLQSNYVKLQDEMWITTTKSITAASVCGDGAKVSTNHLYETCKLNDDALNSMQVTLQAIRDHIQEELTLYAYSSQLSKLQVESYLHNLFMNSPALRDIPKNSPVHASVSQRPDMQHQVKKLRDCVSVLFVFHRRSIKDVEFVTNIRQWTERLVAALLRVATFDDHLFILNHVLRCPAGVGKWATSLVQIPPPGFVTTQGSFGNPLLDHLVAALATILFPIQSREEFMSQLRTSLTPESMQMESTWILVDSDGEEDEDPTNAWLYLHENDVVSLMMQFPVTAVFAHILKARIDDSGISHYNIGNTTEADLVRMYAFCTCWVNLLGSGLQTYNMTRYRQLNKRLGKMIRQTVSFVSDHWLNFKAYNTGKMPAGTIERLQIEFDQFFMRATYCILTAQKLGSWQFMADMPYTCVSSSSMWQLLYVLHQGQSHTVNLDTLPSVEFCEGYLKDPDSRQQLADNLLSLQTSETIYLLTTFANMAQCRPAHEVDFIQTVTFSVFEISYTCDHTREFCSKVGRELLSSIVITHPFILSLLLQRSKEVMPKLGNMSLYLFRELPMWFWVPSDPDMLVLRQWLLNSDITQPENQLSRLILSRMNWSNNPRTLSPVLAVRLHRQVALLLVEAYTKFISNRNMGAVIGEGIRQMASAVRQNQTQEQQFNNWTWELLLKLKLHKHSITSPSQSQSTEVTPPDLLKDDWLMPVVKALKLRNPVACFVAVAMTNVGHNTTAFVTDGMDHLLTLSSYNQFTAVIHLISCVVPYFYGSSQFYLQSEGFLRLQQALLAADESLLKVAKSVLGTQFPGPVTKQFSDMIQSQILSHVATGKDKTVLIFWSKAIMKAPRWWTDKNCCYIMDVLIQRSFTVKDALQELKSVFANAFMDLRLSDANQGLVTSVVSWIASGITLPSLMERNSFPEFSWLAYLILVTEAEFETESKLWLSLIQEMYSDVKITADSALKRIVPKLKLEQAPAFARLNIYRWAQQALDAPITHPLLPVLWQRFFILYLGRQVFDSSLPERASVGERFFDSMSYSSMLKKMKKRLRETAHYHMDSHSKSSDGRDTNDSSDSDPSEEDLRSKEVHQKLARLYETFALWLDEPRLHDAHLYLPSLPPQYDSTRLLQVFQNQMSPWLEFVDLDAVQLLLAISADDWRKMISASSSEEVRHIPANPEFDPTRAPERILLRLRQQDPSKDPPALHTLKAPVAEISTLIMEEKHSLIHLLDADLNTLRDYTRVFSNRVAQHCAVDGAYLDLLPGMYSNELKMLTLTIECKSKVNPLHRCSKPAVANVQVNEKTSNNAVFRKIDENRAEYKQVMIECLLPPPANVCMSAVHCENAITMLIKMSQSTTDDKRLSRLFDIANTLYFHLATMVNEDTDFYLPTKQFFSSCLEILGQEFVSRDRSQTQLLLQFCLDNPSLSCHVSPHFVPNNSPEVYVSMYEQLIHVLQQRNMTLVFSLLTKFDVWTWLQVVKPSLSDRKRFVEILGSALMSCGAEPEKETKLVFDLYCSHLNSYLQTNFPENLSDVLALVLQGSAVERLHVQCWEILLGECFTPVPQGLAPGQRKPSIHFSIADVEACTDTVLATTQVTDTLQYMSSQFMKMRLQDRELVAFGLYPKWNRYIQYVSQFLGGVMRSFITKMLPNFSEMNPYQVLDISWKQLLDLFAPWIQPLVNPQETWNPWIESDSLVALGMVSMFRKVVEFIRVRFSAKLPDLSSRILGMLLMYYMNCVSTPTLPIHISEIFSRELQSLPWEELKPDLQLVEMMAQLKERVTPHCFHLIGNILPRISWSELTQYLIIYQPPNMTARYQTALLILFIQCYSDKELLEKSETIQLLTLAENFNWAHVSSASYRVITNWFMQGCDYKCVLAERSSALALGLKLMRVAAGFQCDTVVPWSEDLSTKRLMYVHCITQLLCQCSYKSDVCMDSMGTVVVNLLTEIETVETSVSDVKTQHEESLDLIKDVLSLLNNCNPDGSALNVFMSTIRDWLHSSPHSILLTPCIKAANRCLASLEQMVQIIETCIEVYFTADQATGSSEEWDHILAVFQMPELNTAQCVEEAINQGSYLLLYAHCLQQLALCQSYEDELKIVDSLVDWTTKVRPGSENEGKLLLWWQKILVLTLRQLEASTNVSRCIHVLYKFLNQLIVFGEDRASTGLLGVIGFGKKSSLSVKFRIICRTVAAFLATQFYNNTEVRLQPHMPLSNTQMATQTRAALSALKKSKQYFQYKDQIEMVSLFVKDQSMCLRDSLALLQQLVQAFFLDLNYLKCIQ